MKNVNVCVLAMLLVLGLSLTSYGVVLTIENPGFEDYQMAGTEPAAEPVTSTTVPGWETIDGGGTGNDWLYRLPAHQATQFYGLTNTGGLGDHFSGMAQYEGQLLTLSFLAKRNVSTTDPFLKVYFSPDDGVTETLVTITLTDAFIMHSASYVIPVVTDDTVHFRFSAAHIPTGQWYGLDDVAAEVVPEPASLVLMGLGAMMILRRRHAL